MDSDNNVTHVKPSALGRVHLRDYGKTGSGLAEWLVVREDVPDYLWNSLKETPDTTSVEELLEIIRSKLGSMYKGERSSAKSFEESRFTSIDEAIQKRLKSCGVLTNIFGAILRRFNVPVKYIHGIQATQKGTGNRHSWLKIYNPLTAAWVEVDVTDPHFLMHPEAYELREYHDWDELKQRFDKGEAYE